MMSQVKNWELTADRKLAKSFPFPDFRSAKEFVDKVSQIAEQEDHHPDITFGWGYANFFITTHAIAGLSENDFILAAKIDEAAQV